MFGVNTRQIGNTAEDLAENYIKNLGYKVLQRNFTIRGGEIDIIAKDGNELVFVEVKARSNPVFGSAREAVTNFKIKTLQKCALFYIQKINWGIKPYRFDLVAIDYGTERYPRIELIKNITF